LIVEIKREPPDRYGVMPLHRAPDGAWVPIDHEIYGSVDEAVRASIQDVRHQLDAIELFIEERISCAHHDLRRAFDRPTAHDRVRIYGVLCELHPDGTVTLPSGSPLDEPRIEQLREATRDVLDMLQAASRIDSGDRDGQLFVLDFALNQPLDLLYRVAKHAPDNLGEVAASLVQVYETFGKLRGEAPDDSEISLRDDSDGGDS